MPIPPELIEKLIFKKFFPLSRFTQDSPIYPDVWLEFWRKSGAINTNRVDLILTPHRKSTASQLLKILTDRLTLYKGATDTQASSWRLASSGDTVVANLTFQELLLVVLPLTLWWQENFEQNSDTRDTDNDEREWFMALVGGIYFQTDPAIFNNDNTAVVVFKNFYDQVVQRQLQGLSIPIPKGPPVLFSVSRNRQAGITVERSVPATKADSGRRLFDIDGSDLAWAVLDTGIDARHPAFRKIDPTTKKPFVNPLGAKNDRNSNNTRIIATYDFTKFRDVVSDIAAGREGKDLRRQLLTTTATQDDEGMADDTVDEFVTQLQNDLKSGRLLDWTTLGPLLRVPHNHEEYVAPLHPHGTHVAGIIGAHDHQNATGVNLVGMCPGISLYDIRVLDQNGQGNEFNILAALQFVRWMNMQRDDLIIHGANLSFSMPHEVASYACGQTPVCTACDRLVSEGIVVVASAGNQGLALFRSTEQTESQGFRTVNITDPGNADLVITVGATHRNRPHSYGVSYFSSRGPTGDGRSKPDLVAPGEKIVSSVGEKGSRRMDGTSMAAPHVSGAAALLMAKHNEFIGRPRKVKEVLCKTATDLGREKYFQGCGMLDVLRAIQSV